MGKQTYFNPYALCLLTCSDTSYTANDTFVPSIIMPVLKLKPDVELDIGAAPRTERNLAQSFLLDDLDLHEYTAQYKLRGRTVKLLAPELNGKQIVLGKSVPLAALMYWYPHILRSVHSHNGSFDTILLPPLPKNHDEGLWLEIINSDLEKDSLKQANRDLGKGEPFKYGLAEMILRWVFVQETLGLEELF